MSVEETYIAPTKDRPLAVESCISLTRVIYGVIELNLWHSGYDGFQSRAFRAHIFSARLVLKKLFLCRWSKVRRTQRGTSVAPDAAVALSSLCSPQSQRLKPSDRITC